ncbi:MAG TPA: 4-alpha-glucanotransferase, partial [Deltaproteobacteria bacterium]|nr:4-alpha-glucanotransferase [Deltaproteobacteria bacterium]
MSDQIRRAGLLVHPTSLPGPFGIGDLGAVVRELLPWMDAARLGVWQILPLNPVDDVGCPYASASVHASEPLLLSIDELVDAGWLLGREKPYSDGPVHAVDWPGVAARKGEALALAADRVRASIDLDALAQRRPELSTYALYHALRREQGVPWALWPEPLRHAEPRALAEARDRLGVPWARQLALQWLFDEQWAGVRASAAGRGIQIWGDVPFFIGWDSCDVWSEPGLWRLDDTLHPEVISGVPPDAFSPQGQLWGHPLFDEAAHLASGHRWWLARLARALEAVDRVRLDHFRGIEAVWEVEAGASDARGGRWIPGPGRPLLESIAQRFPTLPFFAEDLGVITEAVTALRRDHGLDGMVILQFAFGGDPTHPYLPHNHRPDQVCYTGTHDNDTTLGWYLGTDEGSRDRLRRYLSCADRELPWALVGAALRSVCNTAVVPLQDLLGLGSSARMNLPG